MSAVNRAAVEAVLRQYTDPYLNQDPVSAGCVRSIEVLGDQVSVRLELGYAAGLFKNGWAQMLQMAIEGLDGVRSASVDIHCVIAAHKAQAQIPGLANVKNVVAVASGKGAWASPPRRRTWPWPWLAKVRGWASSMPISMVRARASCSA